MSFSNTGVYTAPTGAINATPGAVIRSATWNTIFVNISAALTQLAQQSFTSTVVTTTSTSYTVASTDSSVIFNVSGAATVALPTASSNAGRWLTMKTVAAQPVVSATTVVAPLTSTTLGITIVSGTAGKWARMQSDGTSWIIMMGN